MDSIESSENQVGIGLAPAQGIFNEVFYFLSPD
jgi:hypothetical protein